MSQKLVKCVLAQLIHCNEVLLIALTDSFRSVRGAGWTVPRTLLFGSMADSKLGSPSITFFPITFEISRLNF